MEQYTYHSYPPSMGVPVPDDTVLLARLRAQVEFYFSPQNLAKDTFLRSLLEQNLNAVPVETIANFPKVRELHAIGRLGMVNVPHSAMPPADPSLLCRALEGSLVVTVSNDGRWFHLISESIMQQQQEHGKATPNQEAASIGGGDLPSSPGSPSTTASSAGVPTHPIQLQERTTVIVRDVPEGTSLDEVMKLFSTNAFHFKSANHDVANNTWHITFYNETDATAAVAATHNQVIHGAPISVSLQSEGAISTALPPQTVPAQMMPAMPQQQAMQQQYAAAAGYPVMMQGYPVYEHHPYYGVPIMQQQQQQQQQQQYYGGGYGAAAPVHYVENAMYAAPPNGYPPQMMPQQEPPNHHAAYLPPQPHHAAAYNPQYPHYHQQTDMMMRPPQYNKHKKKHKSDRRGPGNYNNNRDAPNRPNSNKYDRQNNYDRDNRSNNNDNRQNGDNARQNNGHDRDNRKDHAAATVDPNAFQNRNADSQPTTWNNNNNNNNEGKKKNSRKKKNKGKNEMFGQENFPALVENGVAKEGNNNNKSAAGSSSTAGYAAALKKKPAAGEAVPLQAVVAAAAPPSGESTLQTDQLEPAMSKLNVNNDAKQVKQEFWEVEVPDVW